MKITEAMIPHIEKALGFELYIHQVIYLLDKGSMYYGRGNGKTVAYCVKLALSDGAPLNLKEPEEFSDELGLSNHVSYSRNFFRNEFMKIRESLKTYGFPVIDVIGEPYANRN